MTDGMDDDGVQSTILSIIRYYEYDIDALCAHDIYSELYELGRMDIDHNDKMGTVNMCGNAMVFV